MMKVVAVTVTYNDAEYLKKCVKALLEQTTSVYKIIIVDNNSNEQNKSEIKSFYDYDKIDILELNENLGGAGGFERGVEYAKKYNPDWFWIMDADAYPTPECLDKMLVHIKDRPNIGYLAPLIFGVDLQQYQLYHHKSVAKYLERDIPLYENYEQIPSVSNIVADAFVGPLFSKEAVDSCGLPDGQLFIYGDDLEYTYRITRKFDALLIRDAIINHRDQPNAQGVQQPKNWWKDYYMFRNRLLFIDKYQDKNIDRIIGHFLVWLRIFKQKLLCKKNIKDKRLKKVRLNILDKAYKDGINGISGKSVDPAVFVKLITG